MKPARESREVRRSNGYFCNWCPVKGSRTLRGTRCKACVAECKAAAKADMLTHQEHCPRRRKPAVVVACTCVAQPVHAAQVSAAAPSADSLLHRLWTKAVGTPGYNKADWQQLERFIHPDVETRRLRSEVGRLELELITAKAETEIQRRDHLDFLRALPSDNLQTHEITITVYGNAPLHLAGAAMLTRKDPK